MNGGTIRSLDSNERIHANVLGFHFVGGRGLFTVFSTIESFVDHDMLYDLIAIQFGERIIDNVL
jgi:hypothetical protein